jgi:hypothetical protein
VNLLILLLACDAALIAKASARADALDLRGALEVVRTAGDCDEAAGGAEYLEGLLGAAEAVEKGGTVDSLREVRSATHALSRRSEHGGRRWEAASVALRAVAAASQQERGEMAIYLAEATRVEGLLLAGGLSGAPFITVHELAGDLWLQIHLFAEARAAYERAAAAIGYTPRILVGLARAAEELKDTPGACGAYRSLFEWWQKYSRDVTSAEMAAARTRAGMLGCQGG